MKKGERNLLIGAGIGVGILYLTKPKEETMMGWLTGLGGLEDLFSAAEAGSEGGGAPMPEITIPGFPDLLEGLEGILGKLEEGIPGEPGLPGLPGLPGEPGLIETIFEPIKEGAEISGEIVKWGIVGATTYGGYRLLKKTRLMPRRIPATERLPMPPRSMTTTPTRTAPITNKTFYRASLFEKAKWQAKYGRIPGLYGRIPRPVRVAGGAAGLASVGWFAYEFLFGGLVHAAGEEQPYYDPFTALAWVTEMTGPELFEAFPTLRKAERGPTPTWGIQEEARMILDRLFYQYTEQRRRLPHISAASLEGFAADPFWNPSAEPIQTPTYLPHISAASMYDPYAAQKQREAGQVARIETMLGSA